MRRMSKIEEAGMVNVINVVMDKVRAGVDPTEAVIGVADQQKLASEKAARVCEACNKILSIDKLSSPDVAARSTPYPLADAAIVMRRLEPGPGQEVQVVTIRKTASEGIPVYATEVPVPEYTPEERAYLDEHVNAEAVATTARLTKLAMDEYFQADSESRQEELGAEKDFVSLVEAAENLNNQDAANLARYIEATYGELGTELVHMLADATGKEMPPPSAKEASAFVSLNTPIYTLVDRFMERGCARLEALIAKEVACKQASDGFMSYLDAASTAAERINPKQLPVDDGKNPFSPEITLRMKNLALKDGFANMYLDDSFLSQYPPETVLDAYNKVLQLYPDLAMRQNADALITSMVKRVVTSNNELDPLEIPGAIAAGKALSDSRFRDDSRKWD